MRKIRNIRDFKEFFFVIHTHMDQFQQKVILNIKAMVSIQIHLQTALHSWLVAPGFFNRERPPRTVQAVPCRRRPKQQLRMQHDE